MGSFCKQYVREYRPFLGWLTHRKHFVFVETLHGKPVQSLVSTAGQQKVLVKRNKFAKQISHNFRFNTKGVFQYRYIVFKL